MRSLFSVAQLSHKPIDLEKINNEVMVPLSRVRDHIGSRTVRYDVGSFLATCTTVVGSAAQADSSAHLTQRRLNCGVPIG